MGITQLPLPVPTYRTDDPETSKKGGESIVVRAGSQRHTLLRTYSMFPNIGLIDEEAGEISGLSVNPRCCYWKRCSELRAAGYIQPTGEEKNAKTGNAQMICVITPAGLEVLK